MDADGNIADIVMSADSTVARTNFARLYMQYFNSAARDVTKRLRNMLPIEKPNIYKVKEIPQEIFDQAYNYLLGYYECISPKQFEFFKSRNEDDRREHMLDVLKDGVYNFIPIGNPIDPTVMVENVQMKYPPTYGPVSYTGISGRKVVTDENVRIGPMYFMLLDKIADDWSSISTGRLQHYGVLSPQTRADKYTQPYRESPVRLTDESTTRILVGYCGVETIAEMMDRSNNPLAQRNITYNILDAKHPTNIDRVVDREYITLGSPRPIQLVQHIFNCAGFQAKYVSESVTFKGVEFK